MVIKEDNLIEELDKRNSEALEYIIQKYANLIFKVVINVLCSDNRELAKECISDIYMLVWNKYKLYNPEKASFKNWLLAVSKYKAIDYKRARKNLENVELDKECIRAPIDVEKDFIDKENVKEVLGFLNNEKPIDKEIFIRKYIYEESIKEISKNLNLSKGAVYNRLWRTRNSLTEKIECYKKEVIE
ncbi:sigma-70 family RNA polymerase sigma factor [Clostridium intestinale]|uniref:sigma-70 family RNA polymerase sigma factor n=1 Tax=Clostridium intestinale TaxID=36845 RepID=UPI0028ED41C3|nr:sigma-70 family RNA polymerase sigma factor [Clostridium intestinale]